MIFFLWPYQVSVLTKVQWPFQIRYFPHFEMRVNSWQDFLLG